MKDARAEIGQPDMGAQKLEVEWSESGPNLKFL
jgi:hypothetical protein